MFSCMELVTGDVRLHGTSHFHSFLRDSGLDLVGVAGIPSVWELGVVVTGMLVVGRWL